MLKLQTIANKINISLLILSVAIPFENCKTRFRLPVEKNSADMVKEPFNSRIEPYATVDISSSVVSKATSTYNEPPEVFSDNLDGIKPKPQGRKRGSSKQKKSIIQPKPLENAPVEKIPVAKETDHDEHDHSHSIYNKSKENKNLITNKVDELSLEWKLTTTADYHQKLKLIEDKILEGVDESDVKSFELGFEKQKRQFDDALRLAKTKGDTQHEFIQSKTITMGCLVDSFKVAKKYLDELLDSQKVSLTKTAQKQTQTKIIFAIFREITKSNLKTPLSKENCKEVVDSVLAGKESTDLNLKSKESTSLQKDYNDKVQKMLDLEASVIALNEKIKTFEETKEELQKIKLMFDDESEKKKKLMLQLSQSELEKDSLKEQLTKRNDEFKETENKLNAELKKLQSELDELNKKYKNLSDEKISLKTDLEKVTTESTLSKQSTTEVMAKLGLADSKIKMLELDLDRSQKATINSDSKLNQLQTDLMSSARKIRELEDESSSKSKEAQALQEKVKEYSMEIDQMQLNNQVLLSKLNKSKNEIEELEKQIRTLSKDLAAKNQESFELQLRLQQSIQEKNKAHESYLRIKAEKEELRKEFLQTKNELKNQMKKLASKNNNIEKILKNRDELSDQYRQIKEKLIMLEFSDQQTKNKSNEDISRIKSDITTLEAKIKDTSSQLELSLKEKQQLINEIQVLKAIASTKNDLISKKDQSLALIKGQSASMEKTISDQSQEINKINKQSMDTLSDLNTSKNALASKINETTILTDQSKKDVLKIDNIQDNITKLKEEQANLKKVNDFKAPQKLTPLILPPANNVSATVNTLPTAPKVPTPSNLIPKPLDKKVDLAHKNLEADISALSRKLKDDGKTL